MSNNENTQDIGSSPSRGTTFTEETGVSSGVCTDFAQNNPRPADGRVKFPVTIQYRGRKAKVYKPGGKFAYYRLAYDVAGKRRMQTFTSYSDARKAADRVLRDMANGSQAAALTATQSRDALLALQRLQEYYQSSGRRVSLLDAVSQFADAGGKLGGGALGEAIDAYLRTSATVKRKDISEAVEEFIAAREPLAVAKAGKRAQLSSVYAYNVANWLREFARTFPATAICDLSKEHLNAYIQAHSKVGAKSRNDRRATVRMFLTWCVRADYLSMTHRLFEANGMTKETVDIGDIDFYRPPELRAMLQTAAKEPDYRDLLPMIALGGLAGLRVEECLRLDWADVWHTPGHVHLISRKAKGRKRRLVEMVSVIERDAEGKEVKLPPTLTEWLIPFKESSGPIWGKSPDAFHESFTRLRELLKIPPRRNGLRHAFCTYHYALFSNENLTAAQAGNSAQMLHTNYKGLATKADATKWFSIAPAKSDNVVLLPASHA